MSAYDLDTVLKKWKRDELSTEQAVGQILLILQNIMHRVGRLEVVQEYSRRRDKPSNRSG